MGGRFLRDLVERVDRQAAEIGVRLENQRRYRAHQHGLGDALGTVAPDVAGNLSAASGVANMDRVCEVERFDKCRGVVCIRIRFDPITERYLVKYFRTFAEIWRFVILSTVSKAAMRPPMLFRSRRCFSSPFASPGPNIKMDSASPMLAMTAS